MFDDLRNDSDDKSSFFQDDLSDIEPLLEKKSKKSGSGSSLGFNSKTFLGMNASQRFVISTLILIVVCIMGAMLLMITGSIGLF
jgi:hypothetical protein